MFESPGLLLALFAALIFFGGKKFPELARGLGQGIKEFRKAQMEDEDETPKKAASATEKPKDGENQEKKA
ncbi:MAG TPA: twin-arginine translocase TatA/TatE family subunit [Chlorobaculum sp.]|nr:twin-arginine translocase TatA/TatE family subunit [Chlorobaculum sp.]